MSRKTEGKGKNILLTNLDIEVEGTCRRRVLHVTHMILTCYSHVTCLFGSEIIKVLTNDGTGSCLHVRSCVPRESVPVCERCEHGTGRDLHQNVTAHTFRVTYRHPSRLTTQVSDCRSTITTEINRKSITNRKNVDPHIWQMQKHQDQNQDQDKDQDKDQDQDQNQDEPRPGAFLK